MLSLIKPTAGRIEIFGKPLPGFRNEILRNIGAIIENADFYNYLSAYKNLEILGRLSRADVSKQNIMRNLEMVNLAERSSSKVKTFSHGMKQRLGLAQALIHNPDLIILDEPTTGLVPQGIKEIRDLIMHLSKEKGKTILLSSHILKEVEIIANRMIIINKGKKQVEGFVKDLMNHNSVKVNIEYEENEKIADLIKNSQWNDRAEKVTKTEAGLNISKEQIPEINKWLVENGCKIYSISSKGSLEDYFLRITENS
jgi:ABC-2 type transport system ATP-binding protein